MDHWSSDEAAAIIGDKTIFISAEKCRKYKVINNQVAMQVIDAYR